MQPARRREHREVFAGLSIDPLTLPALLDRVAAALAAGERLTIAYLNPDYTRRALRDPALLRDLNSMDLLLVDGNGVRLAAAALGLRIPERLDTDTVAPALLQLLAGTAGRRVFLFGCAPGVAASAGRRIEQAYPGLRVVGTEHGFHDVQRGHPGRYAPEDSVRIVAAVRSAAPDLLVVSLPTPLQQRWVAEHAEELGVPLTMTAGSWLDHVAENAAFPASWYPGWARVLRLHWFYRLLRDPRTLWRRYTVESAQFFWQVLRTGLFRG